MRKLGRIVRRVLTAVSLLLFVAVLAAWVRGYWSADVFASQRQTTLGTKWEEFAGEIVWSRGSIGFHSRRSFADTSMAKSSGLKSTGSRRREFRSQEPEDVGDGFLLMASYYRNEGVKVWTFNWIGFLIGTITLEDRIDDPEDTLASIHHVLFALPCWMAALVFGALPSWRGFVWWRGGRRRLLLAAREGRCRGCGYDLRASPQRCPECGLAVEQKREARSAERDDGDIEH